MMPSQAPPLPELVCDTRLQATIYGNTTVHPRLVGRRGAAREERWVRHDNNILGHGGYGLVWWEKKEKEKEQDQETYRAVKAIRVPGDKAISGGARYVRELEALAKFSRPKYAELIVEFLGWYEVPGYLCIATEFCEQGDLRTHLEHVRRMPEDQAKDVAFQVLAGLAMMHEAGFAHRDIKPANILIKSKPPNEWWVKICDLGLSKRAEDIAGSTTVRGTPGFMAPETLGFKPASNTTDSSFIDMRFIDMWCFGETVYRMLTGKPTFESIAGLVQYHSGTKRFPERALRQAGASYGAVDFVRSLMVANPPHRLTARRAQTHFWIRRDVQPQLIQSAQMGPTELVSSATWSPSHMPPWHAEEVTQASGLWTQTAPLLPEHRHAGFWYMAGDTSSNEGMKRSTRPTQGIGSDGNQG